MDAKLLTKYESVESFVFMDQRGGNGSSAAASPRPQHQLSRDDSIQVPALTVAVGIRRGRVLLLTVVVIGFILGITYTFKQGVELSRFKDSEKNATEREKLLDDYNAYSSNVASAFGKPIEVFVALLVQVIALRLMADAFTQPSTSWKLSAGTLVLSAGAGYLINNSFNALNVQLRPLEIKAVISPTDLSITSALNKSMADLTTNLTHTVSEMTPGNLITNTVLRNVVLPRETSQQPICDWTEWYDGETPYKKGHKVPLPTIDYGFSQRDWQGRLLQKALEPKTLRIVVNPKDKDANKDLASRSLPMSASIAADLLVYMMKVAPNYLPWGKFEPDGTKLWLRSATASEMERRNWLLEQIPSTVRTYFNGTKTTSLQDISVEFSRVEISTNIVFDAVTFEVDQDPNLLATSLGSDNSTRYTKISPGSARGSGGNCGPWPALCLVNRQNYVPPRNYQTDALQQVFAFSDCLDPFGDLEAMVMGPKSCSNASDSSIMVMSVGKRLVADSMEQKNEVAGSDVDDGKVLITNLRKVYTVTLGRLSWKLENLSATFNAECSDMTSPAQCRGLQLPLAASSLRADGTNESKAQTLVVRADALPLGYLSPSNLMYQFTPRTVSLVVVSDVPTSDALSGAKILTGDILLRHNAKRVLWLNESVVKNDCDSDIEAVLFTKMSNHMYIEHGFQTAYTAATFYLFQNGAVKDTNQNPQTGNVVTLGFDGNTQYVAVRVSIPDQSAWLTLAGCVLLGVGLVVAMVPSVLLSTRATDPLASITAPHTIARVMLDDKQFPALLLHRRVVDMSKDPQNRKLDTFVVAGLAVEDEEKSERHVALQ